MSETTWTILLVGEGNSDERRVPILVDAWIRTSIEWADLSFFRRYCGLDATQSYTQTRTIPNEARGLGLSPFRGDFSGHGDHRLLAQLRQVLRAKGLIDRRDLVVIWSRDFDSGGADSTRAASAARDMAMLTQEPPILRAVANKSGEAWVLLGWRPENREETEAHREITEELGFDPLQHPERLSPKGLGRSPKSGKAVVSRLVNSREREETCLLAAASTRDERAEATGLSTFRLDVEAWLSA